MKITHLIMTSAVALGLTAPAALAEWQPRKPVEFVIMAGKGGGADQIARLLQGLIQKKGLSPRPFIPVNKGGGSGAEALRYMQDKAGDDHTVMMSLNSFYTTSIIQPELGVDPLSFTPIGLMAMDSFLVWVNSSRDDITDLDSFVAAATAAGKDWKVGGTGSGQEDSVLTAMMEAEFGFDVTYVPFDGGGTVAKNLVGNHVNSTVNNPSEQLEFWRAGDTKPIVQFSGERMAAFPDVPTSKELGHDIEYYMQRSVSGPPGMSPEAVEWYVNLFEELYNSPEWQEYCVSEGLDCPGMMKGQELADFHAKQLEAHKELVAKVGAAKITGE